MEQYKPLGVRVRKDINRDLGILAATVEKTKQELVEEAILDLLKKYSESKQEK